MIEQEYATTNLKQQQRTEMLQFLLLCW